MNCTRFRRVARRAIFALVPFACCYNAIAQADDWQAGIARVAITPSEPMWMSGYASRNHPAEGKLHDLWAKALVLQDPHGERVVFVTLDLVGIGRDFSKSVRAAIEKECKLPPERCALLSSHTHSGPVVGDTLLAMYFLDERQARLVSDYTSRLREQLVRLVNDAIADLAPAHLAWTHGTATFAVNRRENKEADVPRLLAEGKIKGPFDHDVPVLTVTSGDKLRAILFGYACHATVLDGYQWCGDYPGFAQADLEMDHPGCTALFFAGCGADQNPLPRRQVELAIQYGRQLADVVNQAIAGKQSPIQGDLAASYQEIPLELAEIPTREQLDRDAKSSDRYQASRAKLLLARLDAQGAIDKDYPYPVQVWRLGDGPTLIHLGGEVVVDYALRLKSELDPTKTWVAGYANDVMAYIPSRRVLAEGGYEGGGAMVYYGLPSPWAPDVEERIVRAAREQVHKVRAAQPASE
ncbi:MAG: neutral/alkaline non-lysosomal ceramidase N-terminal domain-containing protein [Pirellulales bacterium]|nr:neutral/alkaline non-lysosomal ceramidase N-terminal domain-containing protein [Pirellulales bacterium]